MLREKLPAEFMVLAAWAAAPLSTAWFLAALRVEMLHKIMTVPMRS